MQNDFETKKGHLDELYYFFGNQQFDFELAYMYIDKYKKVVSSAWRRYTDVCFDFEREENLEFLELANNRTIFPNEIVIDMEKKEQLDFILKEIDREKFCYYLFDTQSRGYHIHLFFDEELTPDAKMRFLLKYNVDVQKSFERTMIALEYAMHYKSGKIKKLVKKVSGINSAKHFFGNNDIEKRKIEVNLDEKTARQIKEEAIKFRAEKIKEILSKKEITAFERKMLNKYYENPEFKKK
jgi:hypothetical protein